MVGIVLTNVKLLFLIEFKFKYLKHVKCYPPMTKD